ncbi:hypothetical protein CVT24_002397 [Panaeolus cyanescens]|uniref:Uncharacterized protein n=1 Tax=Panaeolus cyanescens TaxID=181874 RepID=A0A409W111_9AGAR|nr:hypothetical protein CVT24_002397 [Panaeolus cyanescens]
MDITEHQTALAKIEDLFHHEKFISHLSAQLSDPSVRAQAANALVNDAHQLATWTLKAYTFFEKAAMSLSNLGQYQGSWPSQWQNHFSDYKSTVKDSLELHKLGIDYFEGFNNEVVNQLDWVENNFEEAKRLVKQYLEKPQTSRLKSESSTISQRFTDEGRLVNQFGNDFSDFVSRIRQENQQAQSRLEGDISRLNAEIARYNSAAEQIKRALTQIAGIPFWLTWVISEILQALGLTSADDARRALDMNYAEQARLNDQKRAVQREIDEKHQMDYDLGRANNALSNVKDDIAKIMADLNSFSTQWINNHHDIEAVFERMNYAQDSATKRSLISRLNLMGISIEALVSAMRDYVASVEASH